MPTSFTFTINHFFISNNRTKCWTPIYIYFIHISKSLLIFFFQAEDGIRHGHVTGVQTCALPISNVIDPARGNLQKNIEQWTNGKGVNVVIETSGNAKAIQDAFNTVNRGGRIVCVGMPVVNDIPVNINHMIDSELDVYGVFRYANTYSTAIQALKNPHLDIEKVITHQFALTDIQEAVDVARNQKDTSIKVMIYPGK